MTERMHAFVARDLKPVGQALEPGEHITVEPLRLFEVRRRLIHGQLRDGKTIATLATYFLQNTA
jgi:hypothetical protein